MLADSRRVVEDDVVLHESLFQMFASSRQRSYLRSCGFPEFLQDHQRLPTSSGNTSIFQASLLTVIVAILHDQRALAVGSLKGLLVCGENVLRFFQPDDLDVFAHQPECVCEISDVLMLRMQRTLRTNTGADDDARLKAAAGNLWNFVQVVD